MAKNKLMKCNKCGHGYWSLFMETDSKRTDWSEEHKNCPICGSNETEPVTREELIRTRVNVAPDCIRELVAKKMEQYC